MLPGMKVIIDSMLMAIEPLANVVVLLLAVFVIFGILATQLFMGIQHQRCRLTPFPVKLEMPNATSVSPQYLAAVLQDPALYRCIPEENNDVTWNQKSSPWSTPHACFWPIDSSDTRICSTGGGAHLCDAANNRTCGSNFDAFGNPRFLETDATRFSDNFIEDLNWGYTTFDNLLYGFITIFQCITEEGWVDVMYQLQDGFSTVAATLYFIGIIVFGSFLLLNLTLAVLEDALSAQKELEEERLEEERLELSQSFDASEGVGTSGRADTGSIESNQDGPSKPLPPEQACRRPFFDLVTNPKFDAFIIFLILFNTGVLAADHHPMEEGVEFSLEIINFTLAILFTIEMVLKLIGLGFLQYVRDGFNCFDAIIVILSFVEIGLSPPRILTGGTKGGDSALSALRTFRLFRVFKLARSWSDLRIILEKIIQTFGDVSNFAALLVIFMYIFALTGMQFFANRFRFDENGVVVPLDHASHGTSEQPRAHFDSIGWSLVTIFQMLSGENWNTLMYDGIRAGGWLASIYFIVLVILGDFIILNLFLAILLTNFDGLAEAQNAEGQRVETEDAASGNGKSSFMEKLCCRKQKEESGSSTKVAPVGDSEGEDMDAQNEEDLERKSSMAPTWNFGEDQVSPLKVAPSTPGSAASNSTLDVMQRGQVFSKRLQKNRRGSLSSPSLSRSMTMHATDLVADLFIQLQDGSRVTISVAQEPDRGGITMTIGQLQTEIFKKTHVPPEDQELSWMQTKWDTSKRIVKNQRLCDTSADGGVKTLDTIHMKDIFGLSLNFIPPNSSFRLGVRQIVRNSYFDNFILVLIITSSLMLAVESPFWEPGSTITQIFRIADIVMTTFFTIEMVLKIIAYGFAFPRAAYLQNGWNVLDFIIVIVSILSLSAGDGGSLKSLRSLRTLRALRPLRMISRRPQLKLVVNSLFAAIPNVLNVLIVCILFLLIFAIFATNYFKGLMRHCVIEEGAVLSTPCAPFPSNQSLMGWQNYVSQSDVLATQMQLITYPVPWSDVNDTIRACVFNSTGYEGTTSKVVCQALGHSWEKMVNQDFDNVMFSIGALFELSTTEGWVDVMYATIDSRGIDMQPIRDSAGGWAFFWVFYIVVGSFFVMNLFVGVVIEAFNNQKAEKEGDSIEKSLFADEDQKKWMKTQSLLLKLDPKRILKPPAEGSWRLGFFKLVMHPKFEITIMICIIINTIAMGTKWFGQPYEVTLAIEILNYMFTAVYIVEMVLKLIGYGTDYFKDGWNIFDFTIVIAAITGYVVNAASSTIAIGPVAAAVRAFRIGRLIRLVRSAPKLRELVNTLILTLPALGNISAVLFLLFFIYAVMGVQLFSKIKLGEALNEQANFQSFEGAMMMLFRSATGENWNGVMYDLARTSDCNSYDVEYNKDMCGFSADKHNCIPLDGCGTPAAYVYYVTFTLFVTFVFFNLFIAVILEASEISTDIEEESLSEEHLNQFMKQWVKYDPNDQRSITVVNLRKLLQDLDKPMGFGIDYVASDQEITDLIKALQIPIYINAEREPIVLFMDTAHALAGHVHDRMARKNGKSLAEMQALSAGSAMSRRQSKALSQNLMLAGLDESAFVQFTTAEMAAAANIQRSLKAFKLRREINKRVVTTRQLKKQQARPSSSSRGTF